MANALGFIEITGVVAAMDALDIMCKAADVTLATWERKLGTVGYCGKLGKAIWKKFWKR